MNCLASRYLGGGSTTHMDEEHPYRSSPQFSLMFWNLGNWCRKRFEQCPLPERLQRFVQTLITTLIMNTNQLEMTSHKHFISCSYRDLDFLATHLDGITTQKFTKDLATETHGYGDCCMMSIVEWGHARRYCQRISTTLMTKITWIMLVSLHSG